MPIAPYTWLTEDFVTASRLQAELRMTGGQPFAGNGTGWHTQRPVYRSFTTAAPPAATSWTKMSGSTGASWSALTDTAAMFGSRADPLGNGQYSANGVLNSSGAGLLGSQYGGYFLGLAQMPWTSGAGTAAISIGQNAPPRTFGTFQPANTTPQCTWAADLFDWVNINQGLYESTATAVAPSATSGATDGSGTCIRQQGFWASVYKTSGTALAGSSLPVVTPSWAASSAVTAAALNTNIRSVMDLLNMPPAIRYTAPNATSCASGSYVPVSYSGASGLSPTIDTYAAFSATSGAFTAPLPGLYLVIALAGFDSTSNSAVVATGVTVNGSANYMGPPMLSKTSQSIRASKAQVFSLHAGDTVSQFVIQYTGSTINTSTAAPSTLLVLWLGYNSAPATLPVVPDVTWMFQAGLSPSALVTAFNSHFANDLLFLTQRPYCLAYQTSAQSGITSGTATPLTLQSNTGIVHGDSATSYGGWSTSTFTAPVNGFYLCVLETAHLVPSLTTSPSYAAGFKVSPGGTDAVDYYGQQSAITGLAYGGGSTAVAINYLMAGDQLQPITLPVNVSSTTTSTYVNTGSNPVQTSHFEAVWLSE